LTLTRQTEERLERGRALYNSGRYFEAHEAWEDAWRVETGPVRLTLHGLIQVAAGLHKAVRQSQPVGCVRLLQAGLDKLRDVPEDSCGFALGEFREAVVEALARARRWQAGDPGLDGQAIARLKLAACGPEGTG
jgi:predicted metal-dependent hydrolase